MATMRTKSVGFNIDSAEELKIHDYAMSKPNFSRYIKELITADMNMKKPTVIRSEGKGINIKIEN